MPDFLALMNSEAGALSSPVTVEGISSHMQEQTYSYEAGTCRSQCHYIETNSNVTMKRMKTDAASAGVEDGGGQQMVKIYQHGQQKDQVSSLPLRPVESVSYQCREDEVKEIVNDLLHICH